MEFDFRIVRKKALPIRNRFRISSENRHADDKTSKDSETSWRRLLFVFCNFSPSSSANAVLIRKIKPSVFHREIITQILNKNWFWTKSKDFFCDEDSWSPAMFVPEADSMADLMYRHTEHTTEWRDVHQLTTFTLATHKRTTSEKKWEWEISEYRKTEMRDQVVLWVKILGKIISHNYLIICPIHALPFMHQYWWKSL